MLRSNGYQFFSFKQLAEEQANLYMLQGEKEKARETLEECLQFCIKNKYSKSENEIKLILSGIRVEEISYNIILDKAVVQRNIEAAEKIGMQKECIQYKKHINFLEKWQDLMGDAIDANRLLDASVVVLKKYFKIDEIIFLNKKEENFYVLYQTKNNKLLSEDIKKIIKFLESKPEGFAVSRTEKVFMLFEDILSIFNMNKIASFMCVPIIEKNRIQAIFIAYINIHDNFITNNEILDKDKLVIFRSACRQLISESEIGRASCRERV